MNLFKKLTLAMLLCIYMLSNAHAENKSFVITKAANGKIQVYLSDLPKDHLAVTATLDPKEVPQGDVIFVLVEGKRPYVTTRTVKQVFNDIGGVGSPEIILFETIKNDDDSVKKNIEIKDLANNPNAAPSNMSTLDLPISPLDGVWQTTMSGDEIKGCPAQIVAQFAARMNEHTTEDITFSQPFHPTDLKDGYKQLKWQKSGLNRWRAEPVDMGPGKKTGAPNMSFYVATSLNVISETRINVSAIIDVKVAKALAFALGGSTHCSVTFIGKFEKK